jgi:hypothetical protein
MVASAAVSTLVLTALEAIFGDISVGFFKWVAKHLPGGASMIRALDHFTMGALVVLAVWGVVEALYWRSARSIPWKDTPRELGKEARRYWWLVLIALVAASLAVFFSLPEQKHPQLDADGVQPLYLQKESYRAECDDATLPTDGSYNLALVGFNGGRIDLDEPEPHQKALAGAKGVMCTLTNLSAPENEDILLRVSLYRPKDFDLPRVPPIAKFSVTADHVRLGPPNALSFYIVNTTSEPMRMRFGGGVMHHQADRTDRGYKVRPNIPNGIAVDPLPSRLVAKLGLPLPPSTAPKLSQ